MGRNSKAIIIGAGPAGIGAGLALGKAGTVLEAASTLGGLCRTIEFEGAVVDLGGHSFHTPHSQVRDLVFGSLEMYQQPRDARCFTHGKMIPYPFQSHFHELGDPQLTAECEAGLEERDPVGAADFEAYLRHRFGAGIADHFLLPYNRKLWGLNLRLLAADWAGERVAPAREEPKDSPPNDSRRRPLLSGSRVAYPARGGFGEVMRALAQRLPDLRLGKAVEQIDISRRVLRLANGEVLPWVTLISTVPLDRLMGLIDGVPGELITAVGQLRRLSLALVVVVVNHPVDTPIQRVYCACPEQPAHKIAINHNSSPYLRELPQHGIVAEVSYSEHKPLVERGLEERVINGLIGMGLIGSSSEVRASQTIKVPYGYPVPTHERDEIVGRAAAWLRERGILTVGRFGEWAYINSDEAIHRGIKAAESC